MSEFEISPMHTIPENGLYRIADTKEYAHSIEILRAFTDQVLDSRSLVQQVAGVGAALHEVIRANGKLAPKRGIDNAGERYVFLGYRDDSEPERGHWVATTNGTVVSLFDKPRGDTNSQLPLESTFIKIPVNDQGWNPDLELLSLKIGDQEPQNPTVDSNGLLPLVYATILRQNVARVVDAAIQPIQNIPQRQNEVIFRLPAEMGKKK
jgi:hypothetical protein